MAPPAWGTSYCPRHSGKPDGKTARKRAKAAEDVVGGSLAILAGGGVEERMEILKNATPVDPGVLLLQEVARCAAVVRWLENKIGEMSEEEVMWEPEVLRVQEEKSGADRYELSRKESRTTVSRYWKMLQEERKLLVRATEAALRSNIEERRVRLAERGVNVLEAAVAAALLDLGLDPHSERVRAVVGKRMREALEAGSGSGGIFMGAQESVEPVKVESARTTVTAEPPPPPADF